MNEMTNLRRLRLRHGITLSELGQAVPVSNQQVSRIELLYQPASPELERKYEVALETVIRQRNEAVETLEHDYRAVKGNLLQRTED